MSFSVDTITFEKIIRFKCTLVHFIGAKKVKTRWLTSHTRQNVLNYSIIGIFENYFVEKSKIVILIFNRC